MMEFGNTFKCHTCRKEINKDYHRYHHSLDNIELNFYTHHGICDTIFRGKYVKPFEEIDNRLEILDL